MMSKMRLHSFATNDTRFTAKFPIWVKLENEKPVIFLDKKKNMDTSNDNKSTKYSVCLTLHEPL